MSRKPKEPCAVCEDCGEDTAFRRVPILHRTHYVQPQVTADTIREIYRGIAWASRPLLDGWRQCKGCYEKRKWALMYMLPLHDGAALQGPLCTECYQDRLLELPMQYEPTVWAVLLTKGALAKVARVDTSAPSVVQSIDDVGVEQLF